MQQLTTTPFGRRKVTAGLIATRAAAAAPAPVASVDKWQVFRDLTTARAALGLPSRALTVLSALLSFLPEAELSGDGPIIVFPSNRRLAERAHGMAEATLRRHLAALSTAGLILRHDSPNGKRYAARDSAGAIATAFGFDLRPLLSRAAEIAATARATRDAAETLRRQRERLVLMIRDCEKLAGYRAEGQGADASETARIANLKRALRRKLDAPALDTVCAEATCLMAEVEKRVWIDHPTAEPSGPDAQIERHNHESDSEESCSDSRDLCKTSNAGSSGSVAESDEADRRRRDRAAPDTSGITLRHVTTACPSLARYLGDDPADWSGLIQATNRIRPWLGITAETHAHAVAAMGPVIAAISLACILERSAEIRTPGAYLRSLALRAANTRFNPARMVLALIQRQGGKLTAVNSVWVRTEAAR